MGLYIEYIFNSSENCKKTQDSEMWEGVVAPRDCRTKDGVKTLHISLRENTQSRPVLQGMVRLPTTLDMEVGKRQLSNSRKSPPADLQRVHPA